MRKAHDSYGVKTSSFSSSKFSIMSSSIDDKSCMNVVMRTIRSSFTTDLGKPYGYQMSLRSLKFNDASPWSSSSKFSFLSITALRCACCSFLPRQSLTLVGSSLHLGQEHSKHVERRLDFGESGLGWIWCNF